MPSFIRRIQLLACLSLASMGAAQADTVTINFDTVARYTSAEAILGSAPWLTATITDLAPGSVRVTVNALLSGSGSPPQTLTGIWLNVPNAVGAGLTSLLATPGSGTGVNPMAFGAGGSTFSALQDTTPSGATAAQVGRYNIFLRFTNNGTTSFQGTESQTFDLTGTGLTAASFFALAAQTGAGLPSPSYYALAALTNAAGTAGSGIAYISSLNATLAPVPLPAGILLLASGLLGLVAKRRGFTC
jgi:hypothetical protein